MIKIEMIALFNGVLLIAIFSASHFLNPLTIKEEPLQRTFCRAKLMTCDSMGRTGNQMSQYATLIAIAEKLDYQIAISAKMHSRLKRYFRNVSAPILRGDPRNCFGFGRKATHMSIRGNDRDVLNKIAKAGKPWVHLKGYGNNIELFKDIREKLEAEFRLPEAYYESAKDFLHSKKADGVFVCIHVRRTDYEAFLKQLYSTIPVDVDFYRRAFDYLRGRLSHKDKAVSFKSGSENAFFLFSPDDVYQQ